MTNEQHREICSALASIDVKLDAIIKTQDDHEKRLRGLERFSTHVKGAFAALVMGVGYLLRMWPLAMAILLGSCSAGPDGAEQHWHHRMTFVVDTEMPVACEEAFGEAMVFFSGLGVEYVGVEYRPDPSVAFGTVTVKHGDLSRVHCPGCRVLGLTKMEGWAHRLTQGRITVDECDPLVVAHEVGHALGLEHREEIGNLMHPCRCLGGWALDGDQADWVR